MDARRGVTWDYLYLNPEVFPEAINHKIRPIPEHCVIMRCYDDDNIWYFTVWCKYEEMADDFHSWSQGSFGTTRTEMAEFKPFIG